MNQTYKEQIIVKDKKTGKPKKKWIYYVDTINASLDEYAFANKLIELSIPYTFQPAPPITLIKGFKGHLKNYRDTTYTPDFFFAYNGFNYIIEVKGFMRADNSLKHKLADWYYTSNEPNTKYFVLKYKGSIKQGTKSFYDYSNANFKRLKNPLEHSFFNKEGIYET